MLSLAAFRYRNVLAANGGPIERVEVAETSILGERYFLANAYLTGALAGERRKNLYSQANGSGTDRSPMVARFKAVSESLERWAHWQAHTGPDRIRYGFDIDPSSNGIAAFPGIRARQARTSALEEATERFNLLNWWEGHLPATVGESPWPGVTAVTIRSHAPGLAVILFKRTKEGFIAYGHAGGADFRAAAHKAAAEMERHEQVVRRFAEAHGGRIDGQLPADAHPLERRGLYFAHESGHARFLERLHTPARATAELKVAYDGPIPGPWSRYADVWRVVYEPPSRRFLSMDETYFML